MNPEFLAKLLLVTAAVNLYALGVGRLLRWRRFGRRVRLDSSRLRVVGHAPEKINQKS